jgi:hypothetical protein
MVVDRIHYYTDPIWTRDNRSFVFTSDRENQSNLFRYDLDTGLITQITDLQGSGRPGGCVSAANNALYFGWQGAIRELNLETLEERVLWNEASAPRPMATRGRANPTADGTYICVMLMEDQAEDKPAISFSYSRFREFFHLKPLTQIARIDAPRSVGLRRGRWRSFTRIGAIWGT